MHLSPNNRKRLIHSCVLQKSSVIICSEGVLQVTMKYIIENFTQRFSTSLSAAGRITPSNLSGGSFSSFFFSGPKRLVKSYWPDPLASALVFSQISKETPHDRIVS